MSDVARAPAIRFSVLLPTRNGGSVLAGCLAAVLAQDHPSFEVVVSDNANEDATPTILREREGDPRLVVVRQPSVLSVTENWSAAAAASSGDYLLLIGDDDILLPGTLAALDGLLAAAGDPDCLTFDAFRYVAPAAVSDRPVSFFGSPYFGHDPDLVAAGFVSGAVRRDLVRDMYRFKFRFPLSMQLTVASRGAVARLPRGLFVSAFPDHYAICALLLTARSWFLTDRQLLVMGIAPKSFNAAFLNSHDPDGFRYLGVTPSFGGQLPGNEVLNGQCDWLAATKRDFAAALAGTDIDRGAYVARQVRHWLRQHGRGTISTAELGRRVGLLRPGDLGRALVSHARPDGVRELVRAAAAWRGARADYVDDELTPLPGVTDVTAFSAWLQGRGLTPAQATPAAG